MVRTETVHPSNRRPSNRLRSLLLIFALLLAVAASRGQDLDEGSERLVGSLKIETKKAEEPSGPPDAGVQSWRFDVVADANAYQLLLFDPRDPTTVRRAVWQEGDQTFVWDGSTNRHGAVGTLEQGLDLAIGERAADGFATLLPPGFDRGHPDPTVRTHHWADADSGRVSKTVTTIDAPATAIRRAMEEEDLEAQTTQPSTTWTLVVDAYHSTSDGPPPPRFRPPPGSVPLERWRDALGPALDDGAPIAGGFGEVIDVQISNLVVRVVDSYGEPVTGLTAEDFEVRLGRQDATVLAADWIDLAAYQPEPLPGVRRTATVREIPPRLTQPPLVVFFVQAGLDSSYTRGAMRFHQAVDELIDSLPPGSRTAVVSHDSRLRLRIDFTTEKRRILEALERSIRFGGLGTERRQPAPSLASTLDFRAAEKAASAEEALQVTAEALAEFPGEKTLVYLGWGLGRFGRGGVSMTPDYDPARAALRDADVTVFVLDTTDADAHSLEVGLEQVARDTGGTYEKTNQFPKRAARRLGRTLSGYYVLAVDRSGLDANRKRWRVDLKEGPRSSTVLVVPTPR